MHIIDLIGQSESGPPLWTIVFSMLLTMVLSQAVAAVYVWTFRGLSYTRSYVQTIVVGSIIACMLMLAINNNLAAGLGIAGSLAFVRFRTSMRDPRDMTFVFAALGGGIASGLLAHEIAIIGTTLFCLANIVFSLVDPARRNRFDGLLRFAAVTQPDVAAQVAALIQKGTQRFALVTMREVRQGGAMEHAYHIRINKSEDRISLIHQLTAIDGVSDVTLRVQDETTEL